MEKASSPPPLPNLPDDLVQRIAVISCRRDGLKGWCRSWRGVCRRFAAVEWFGEHIRGGVPLQIVSEHCQGIQLGISLARAATPEAASAAAAAQKAFDIVDEGDDDDDETILAGPIVLVKPGVYSENVRLTKSCALIGWGKREDVVVEGTGWEPAMAFAGLGMSGGGGGGGVLDVDKPARLASGGPGAWRVADTGERAVAANISLRCRNRMQAYAVVVVNGRPTFRGCNLRGGIKVLGYNTRPTLRRCEVKESRGAGIKVTDHGEIMVERCRVTRNAGNGLLIERRALATLAETAVLDNGAEAVLHTPDTVGVELVGEGNRLPPLMVRLGLREGIVCFDSDSATGTGKGTGGESSDDSSTVVVSILPNFRQLREGSEVEEHLHGEAPDALWFRSRGFMALDDDGDGDGDREGDDEDGNGVGDGDGDGDDEDDGFWNVAESEGTRES